MANKFAERDQQILLSYKALRKEGFSRDKAIEIIQQSDYGHLSRSYIKHIIKHQKRHKPKKGV